MFQTQVDPSTCGSEGSLFRRNTCCWFSWEALQVLELAQMVPPGKLATQFRIIGSNTCPRLDLMGHVPYMASLRSHA